jgi:hypothetical protein
MKTDANGKGKADYYVYVYIDPRNHEEFYYGKGCGGRKDAHLRGAGKSPLSKRIQAIRKAGAEPIVRVIARGLDQTQALLIEATLLWKLGKSMTNRVAGHYAKKFRPHDTLNQELPRFDFQNELYFFNVGHYKHRLWENCRKLSFISAGQGSVFRKAICGFHPGDVFAAYVSAKGSPRGYVGIGKIREQAKRINQIVIDGKPLLSRCPEMERHSESEKKSEYVARVKWIKTVARDKAKRKIGIFAARNVRAKLSRHPETIAFLTKEFGVKLDRILQRRGV